ncbi:MAG: 50S ribosomal protein L32 [Planctomycetes bacterium RBG_16_59_8]|nr:MAG: 50S ribosomal protein L32 [Planctomycetes bacterium RBG_16_59_8]
MPPKRKLARSWKRSRRSHHALVAPSLSLCSRCNQPTLPHRVCGTCGYYRGNMVIDMRKS